MRIARFARSRFQTGDQRAGFDSLRLGRDTLSAAAILEHALFDKIVCAFQKHESFQETCIGI
jgi:hypothetical protein